MPITINGAGDNRLGLAQFSLGLFSADIDGSHVAPSNRSGLLPTSLSAFSVDLEGQFGSSENFDGSLAFSINGFAPQIIGNQIQTIDGLAFIGLGGFTPLLQDVSAADSDFARRIAGPGVVWYHNFQAVEEVDQFREAGNLYMDPDDNNQNIDAQAPGTIVWDSTDKFSGAGSLKMLRAAGAQDSKNWNRPFYPIAAGENGRATDDPANGGTLALRSWGPPLNQEQRFYSEGTYGHDSMGSWDGDKFFIQFKMKTTAARALAGGGKITYITNSRRSLTPQEVVFQHSTLLGGDEFSCYTGGSGTLTNDLPPVNGGSPITPWAEKPNFDQWDEFLYVVVPGQENDDLGVSQPGSGGSNRGDSRFRVYRRADGENHYTEIYRMDELSTDWGNPSSFGPQAWQALIISGYQNGIDFPQQWSSNFDEIIFSRQWIPPGRDGAATTLETEAGNLNAGEYTLDPIAINGDSNQWDISWQNRTAFYDENRGEIQYMGKAQASAGGRNRSPHFIYNEYTGSWTTIDTNVTPNSYGHIWLCSFDHQYGNYYHVQQNPAEGGNVQRFLKFTRGESATPTDTWNPVSNAGFNVWSTTATPNPGLCFNPNLFGSGRPGVFCFGWGQWAAWNELDDTWVEGADVGYSQWGSFRQGSTLYVPGLGLMLCGSGDKPGSPYLIGVEDGDTTGTATRATASVPGQGVGNFSPSSNTYMMLLDPRDRTQKTVMLLQRDGGNVYTSNDPMSGNWTLETGFEHPFYDNNPYRDNGVYDEGSWTCCSLPRYGCVLGLSSNGQNGGGRFGTLLWRPGGVKTLV